MLTGVFFSSCSHQPARQSLLLITLDTVRADRVGSYGSTEGLTPNLDRLARESVVFNDVTCQVPLTTPSHATIFTGLLPQNHGVRNNEDFVLAPSVETIAESLKVEGYRTGAFIGAFPLDSRFGLDQGFDVYDDAFLRRTGVVERPADEVFDAALGFILSAPSPFFAFVHLFDAHSPYEPPPPFDERFPQNPYGGEIAYVDDALGRFLNDLDKGSRLDGTVVSILSDHGEALGDHGENTHGVLLYQPTVRVPWILSGPGLERKRVDVPVGTIDLAPTLLAVLGASPPAGADGINLTPHLKNGTRPPQRPIYSESLYLHFLLGWAELRSVRSGLLKLIDSPRPELYDIGSDPGERSDLIAERRKEWRALQKELAAFRDDVQAPASSSNSETARRLESLGYVAGTTRQSGPARNPVDGMDSWREIEAGTTLASRAPDRAREHFERALELDPQNGLALKSLGDIALGRGNAEEALKLYHESLRAGFTHPDLQLAIGRAESLAGQPEKALELFASMDQTDRVLIETARVELGLGRPERSRTYAAKVVGSRPEDIEALTLLAQSQRASGLAQDAEETLRRAIDLEPNEPLLHNELGAVLAQRGAETEAEASFRAALRLDPEAAEAQVNLAKLLEGAEAVALLREAIRLRPGYAPARIELAKHLATGGNASEAHKQIAEALKRAPDEPEALFTAARIEELRGRGAEAVELYRRFLEVAPDDLAEPRRLAAQRLEVLSPP